MLIMALNRKVKIIAVSILIPICAILTPLIAYYAINVFRGKGESISLIPKKEEKWKAIEDISEISGLWQSTDGSIYEWPLELNGKNYLRYAWPEKDDSQLWLKYAQDHNMTLQDLWARRFSYISKIYGVFYPSSDENGSQFGLKVRQEQSGIDEGLPFHVFVREEFICPKDIAEKNIEFFMKKGKKEIKEEGTFNFFSEKFSSLDADGKIYSSYTDYWRQP